MVYLPSTCSLRAYVCASLRVDAFMTGETVAMMRCSSRNSPTASGRPSCVRVHMCARVCVCASLGGERGLLWCLLVVVDLWWRCVEWKLLFQRLGLRL